MSSLDANVVLRFLLGDLVDQARMVETLLASGEYYVTDVVVVETMFVLEKIEKLERSKSTLLMDKFLAMPMITSNEMVLGEAIDLYQRRPKLSFADCYIAAEANHRKLPLYTFDKFLIRDGAGEIRHPDHRAA